MSRGGAERAEKIVKNEHCNWPSAVTAPPRDQVFQLSNFFRVSLVTTTLAAARLRRFLQFRLSALGWTVPPRDA
jgi:hypothetical protein